MKKLFAIKRLALLSFIIASSNRFVQGPGGNTSLKNKNSIFVKASGVHLRKCFGRKSFVEISMPRLNGDLRALDILNASEKPSMEYPFHLAIKEKYVVHVHSIGSISLGIRSDAADIIFNDRSLEKLLFFPFLIPGKPIADTILEKKIDTYKNNGIILQNHGLITWSKSFPRVLLRLIQIEIRLLRASRRCVEDCTCISRQKSRCLSDYSNLTPEHIVFENQIKQPQVKWHYDLKNSLESAVARIPLCVQVKQIDKNTSAKIRKLPDEAFRMQRNANV